MQIASLLNAALVYPQIDPVAFSVGPFSVRWYGLAYLTGILLGWLLARWLLTRVWLWPLGSPPVVRSQLDDLVVWAVGGIILGGRIGYILFYDLPAVLDRPVRALEIWNGGMSFHGGLIGTGLAMALFARRNAVPVRSLFDLVAIVAPLGLFFGRLANFVNGELWGRASDVPWAMIFPMGGPAPRHPTQLYEAGLEGIVLFVLLFYVAVGTRTLSKPGTLTGLFVVGYGVCRTVVEFFREPDVQLGFLFGTNWLTMGMVLSLPMVLVGLAIVKISSRAAPR